MSHRTCPANLNLPNRGVQTVARNPVNESDLRTHTQRPQVLMVRNEPLHTCPVGLKTLLRDVLPVAGEPPMRSEQKLSFYFYYLTISIFSQ